jgi:prephenate dehydratase
MVIVGYQGKRLNNCYKATSELAQKDFLLGLKDHIVLAPYENAEKLIQALHLGLCDYAVIPKTNNLVGVVDGTISAMKDKEFITHDSVMMQIDHILCANQNADTKKVTKVISHPHALKQCTKYLKNNNLELLEAPDTSYAASMTSKKEDVFCICTEEAGVEYGLKLVERGISDQKENVTKFSLISIVRPLLNDKNIEGFYSYSSESYLSQTVIPFSLKRCLKIENINGITHVKGYIEGRENPIFETVLEENSYVFELNRYFSPGRVGRVFLYRENLKLKGYFVVDENVDEKVFGKMNIEKISKNQFERITSEKI